MMKPDWNDAPEWANWLALGIDGEWVWLEEKPEVDILGIWYNQCGSRYEYAKMQDMDGRYFEERP